MVDYNKLSLTAKRLIENNGRLVQIKVITITENDYDPIETESFYDCYAVNVDYKIGQIDGSLIQSNDNRLLVYITDIVPTDKDSIIDNGKEYSIVKVTPKYPGTMNLFYEIQARL